MVGVCLILIVSPSEPVACMRRVNMHEAVDGLQDRAQVITSEQTSVPHTTAEASDRQVARDSEVPLNIGEALCMS